MDTSYSKQKIPFSKEFLKNQQDPTHFTFYKTIRSVLKSHPFFLNQNSVLVAISGGVDSAVLLHMLVCFMLREGGPKIVAAHIHHGIRGIDADRDLEEANFQAQRHGVDFVSEKLNLGASNHQESHMREKRYRALSNLAKTHDAKMVIFGHHKQDQAETLLFRILRGTDLIGLSGMRVLREQMWFRPMLHCQKKDILLQAQHGGLTYRDDQTNTDTSKTRNSIRYHLLPWIQTSINPNVIDSLKSLSDSMQEMNAFLDSHISGLDLCMLTPKGFTIDCNKLSGVHKVVRQRLYVKTLERLDSKGKGFSKKHIQAIDDLVLKKIGGKAVQLPCQIRVEYYQKVLKFTQDG